MRLTITHCPNTPEVISALENTFGGEGVELRKRGRGKGYGTRPHLYSLPMREAERFTLYVDPKRARNGYEKYRRFTFVGLESNGKPRIRAIRKAVRNPVWAQ